MKTNLLHRWLLLGLVSLAALAVRADEEQDLIARLQSSADAPQKCVACQRLRVVGTANAVPALSLLLTEEKTAHAARYALEAMPYPEAGAALREAFGKTTGLIKAGLADSLGWRHDQEAVALLAPFLSDSDVVLVRASAVALGRIGGKDSIVALSAARGKVPAALQPVVLDSLLQCAESLLAEREAVGAANLYRSLASEDSPLRIRLAAWRGLVIADESSRPELVSKALSGSDAPLRSVALKVLRELGDPAVAKASLSRWDALPAEAQLAVLDVQIKLGADALPAVLVASRSPHQAVRVAAWQAIGDFGDASVIPALTQAAARGEQPEREAAREAFARLRGPGVGDALVGQLANATQEEKAVLLRVLGERRERQAAKVLLANASSDSQPVRAAALDSLGKIAEPDTAVPLLELAAKSKTEAESERVLKALYTICQASPDKEQAARPLLESMARMTMAERQRVLPVLAELGTAGALQVAMAALRQPDPESVKGAVRVLSQWPNAAPAESLMELARSSEDSSIQTLSLRGSIEVSAQEADPAKRLAWLQRAMAAARRPEEKKQALGQVGQIPTKAALQVAMAELPEPALADEAGLAAVTIAEKLVAADPTLARETAEKVLARVQTAEIVKRAWAIRGKSFGAGPFIQNWRVCGPYTQQGATGAEALFNLPFGPEKEGEAVTWKAMPRGEMLNLLAVFPDRANCVAYLKTRIIAPEEANAVLLLGSDDGVKAWLNGAVVHSNNVDRGAVVDQDVAPIHLKKGANDLLLKITQGGGGWSVCARIVGANGQALPGLRAEP